MLLIRFNAGGEDSLRIKKFVIIRAHVQDTMTIVGLESDVAR